MTASTATTHHGATGTTSLRAALRPFQSPDTGRSLLQLATSLGGFVAMIATMYVLHGVSPWLALVPMPLAAFLLVRVFIIQHDCGHGAFLHGQRRNALVGHACSLLTLTPYLGWRRQHARHHGVWNDLDRRASGADIYSTCLTLEEYLALGAGRRFWHRLTRHPVVANLLLPPLIFLALYRLPFDMPADWRRERWNVHLLNLALVAFYAGLVVLLGAGPVLLVSLGTMVAAAIVGVWLFSIQHRFEGAQWTRTTAWSFRAAALEGSCHLRLNPVLRWLTGSIGLHHIHHLEPRIPNYALQACQDGVPELAATPSIGLLGGLRATRLALWDEANRRMTTFAAAHRREAAAAA